MMLKRPPKDFPAEFPDIELLKYKSYVVGRQLTNEEVISENLIKTAVKGFKVMQPLNNFLNEAIKNEGQ